MKSGRRKASLEAASGNGPCGPSAWLSAAAGSCPLRQPSYPGFRLPSASFSRRAACQKPRCRAWPRRSSPVSPCSDGPARRTPGRT
eukprot:6186376-Pleurochrysis_carterae.AAC.3